MQDDVEQLVGGGSSQLGGPESGSPPDPVLSEKVRRVIADYLDVPIETLEPGKLLQELGADSLDFIEIVFELEEKFGIEAKEEVPELRKKILSIGDVIQLVASLVADKNTSPAEADSPTVESGPA